MANLNLLKNRLIMISTHRFFFALIVAATAVCQSVAYTLRQIDNTDGLSNSAVLSLAQDETGRLWIGTCDGLNLFDGREVTFFGRTPSEPCLTGELISALTDSPDGHMWISTNYGLNKFSRISNAMLGFPQFQEMRNLSLNSRNHMFVVSRGNAVFYNVCGVSDNFEHLQGLALGRSEVLGIKALNDRLLVFTDQGVATCTLTFTDNSTYKAGKLEFLLSGRISDCFIHDDEILLLFADGNVSEFDTASLSTRAVADLSPIIARRGQVSDMLIDSRGRLFVSFDNSGVVRLTPAETGDDTAPRYEIEDIGVKGGAFCLLADKNQDIVWIGSDGNGVYIYVDDDYSFRTFSNADLGSRISRPIRAIFIDRSGTLWLGTKGDGMLRIPRFNPWSRGDELHPESVTAANSALVNNFVYAFASGPGDGFWIGSDGGVNFASGTDGRIWRVAVDEPIPFVHDIYQSDSNTLWLATVGNGVYTAHIEGSFPSAIRLTDIKRYVVEDGNLNSNFFFSIHHDEHGRILAGNRGFGLFSIENGKLSEVPLKGKYDTKTVSDVFDLTGTADCLWLGTGNGLIKCTPGNEKVWNGNNGFPYSTIHTVLDDGNGNIWAATNRGLVRLDKKTEQFCIYGGESGLGVTEFSDGAAFSRDGTLYFGGINGLVALTRNPKGGAGRSAFVPEVFMSGLKIAGIDVAASDYMRLGDNGVELYFAPDENNFMLTFTVPDYINAGAYTYLYRINGSGDWIQSSIPGSVPFTSMPHGDYSLQVKAVNSASGVESPVKTLEIHIRAPWYVSTAAKIVYALIACVTLWLLWLMRKQSVRRKRAALVKKIRHEQKEKTYEEKLKFFTNITHEFCTPLTLIYGPCERILAHSGADSYVRRYASLIKSNTERLNSLIQELIDFRRVETGHQRLHIARVDVSGLCNDVLASFDVMKEQRGVTFENHIAQGVVWPTDYKCFTKILYNLVSNAFKYTPDGGVIRVGLSVEDDCLRLSVYNTGKGIRPEDRSRIFNRYSILDNVEENATRGLSSRNGLGMAICHSMTTLLGGRIAIESTPGEYAEFIVTLPLREVDADSGNRVVEVPEGSIPAAPVAEVAQPSLPDAAAAGDAAKCAGTAGMKRILVVDDNPDILSLISDSLTDYSVITASNADDALEKARSQSPDLIVTDIMMPGTDGLQFAAAIRSDCHLNNVPIVILSARNSTDDKVDGLQSGADAYVTKPFTIGYLRAVIERLLKGKSEVHHYYNSSASAYQYSNGKLVDKESRQFAENLARFVEENLADTSLSPEMLAAHFQTSTRNLYRKMKDLEMLPPNDFIKDRRIAHATRLLLTTSLTVQEIIYQCGFSNRSHFYKEFDRRHGMTPKDYRMKNRS